MKKLSHWGLWMDNMTNYYWNFKWVKIEDAEKDCDNSFDAGGADADADAITVEVVHPAWVGLIQAGRHYARSHDCHLHST